MKSKNEYLKNNFIPLVFSILGSEIILCCYYSEFSLVWFLIRALIETFYINIFKKIDKKQEKRVIRYVALGASVICSFLISIKILSLNDKSIYSVISSGNILDKRYELSISILLCFILSYVLYTLIFKFIRKEVLFLLFIFLMTLYLKSNCINSIFIYIFIISFFVLLGINIENKFNLNIVIVLSMFFLALIIPAPKDLSHLSMFKGIKDIINPEKYKLTLDEGASTPIYVSREEASNKVLYTFTGDNPTYFISECYDIIANNEWNKVSSNLFAGRDLNIDYYAGYMSDNEKIKLFANLLDDSYSDKGILDIKNGNDEEEIKEVQIVDKNNDVREIRYSYIHPSFSTEYFFNDGKHGYSINGFDRITANESSITLDGDMNLGKVHTTDGSNEDLINTYSMKYKNENPKYGSKDMYIMKNMTSEKYNDMLVYLIKNILNDEEYMKSLTTKQGLEKLYGGLFEDSINDNEVNVGTYIDKDFSTAKVYYLKEGKLKYKIIELIEGKATYDGKVIYDSEDNAKDEDFKELYDNFRNLDKNVVLDTESSDLTYYSMLLKDYYNIDSEVLYDYIDNNEDYFLDSSKATLRMKELALNLTEDKNSTYYKAKAIENYFKSSDFKYSFNVSRTNNENPIDYFIFEGKKGYCIQYATAMVLLCRSVDIPARYVEGYYITEKDKVGDIYEIKEKNAHAFVQVYICGYGWKIFDPTPGFSEENSIQESISVFSRNKEDEFDKVIYILFGITVIVIFICLVLKITYRYRKLRNMLKLPNGEALESLIAYSIELLRECNINYNDGETELEFAERVDTILNIEFKNSMQEYYKYKYASKSISKEEVNKALIINKFIYNYKKKNKKKLN